MDRNRTDIEFLKADIRQTLDRILAHTGQLEPPQFLLDKYVARISAITEGEPTAELINFGMRLMYDISMVICADTLDRRWLPSIASMTCAYYRFVEKH